MSDLEIGVTNHEQAGTELVADPDRGGQFGNDYILRVVQSNGIFSLTAPIDGLRAFVRSGVGVNGASIDNDGIFGTSQAGNKTGVVGINDNNVGVFGRGNARAGVLGNSSGGSGVEGDSSLGVGVLGRSNSASGVVGLSDSGTGVSGSSTSGVGVRGGSETQDGIVGTSNATTRSGVVGLNENNVGVFGRGNTRAGVLGNSTSGAGVEGDSVSGLGVSGRSTTGDAVNGVSVSGRGVFGQSTGSAGVMGMNLTPNGLAGFFQGRVSVVGSFTVFGAKSAAVPLTDGSHRLLYCMESPESWFEDLGEASLVDGHANVQLDPIFASVVNVELYHVFLTPYGDSNGLFVSRRDESGFEVGECGGGKSSLLFSYRVAARRKDIQAERLAVVAPPELVTES